jgi:preprotein translocase subunit SecG
MFTILAIVHILVCIFLILVVLLQTGKGSDIGAVFGGGGTQALFGSAGPGTFLGKLTAGVAIVFMLTSLLMAGRFFDRPSASVMTEPSPKPAAQAPAAVPETAPAAAPQEAAPKDAPAVPEKAPEKP